MYRTQPPIITADTLPELKRKVRTAQNNGQIPKGKVERYANNRIKGYYQVMEWAQISMFDS